MRVRWRSFGLTRKIDPFESKTILSPFADQPAMYEVAIPVRVPAWAESEPVSSGA